MFWFNRYTIHIWLREWYVQLTRGTFSAFTRGYAHWSSCWMDRVEVNTVALTFSGDYSLSPPSFLAIVPSRLLCPPSRLANVPTRLFCPRSRLMNVPSWTFSSECSHSSSVSLREWYHVVKFSSALLVCMRPWDLVERVVPSVKSENCSHDQSRSGKTTRILKSMSPSDDRLEGWACRSSFWVSL